MRRVVVTGATGFLGRNLAQAFLDGGYEVCAIVRPDSTNLYSLPIHGNLKLVRRQLHRYRDWAGEIGHAEGFFHFAWGGVNRGQIDSDEVQEANIQNSLACVRGAALLGCHVFLDAGSRVEYGISRDGRMEEEMGCHPINAYGRAKLAFYRQAASLCRELQMSYYHLRFFSVYGYGDHPWSIVSTLVRELQAGGEVALSACLHRWNFMYIGDAVDAVRRIYENHMAGMADGGVAPGIAVNIASHDTRVLREFVEEVHRLIGSGTLSYGTFIQAKEGALSICPDVGRLERLAGPDWKERYPFREGIREMIEKGKGRPADASML